MIKFLAILLNCFALASSIKQRRIRYGRDMELEEFDRYFKFIVYVLFRCEDSRCYSCTGSLVAPDKVLLAAHCFCDDNKMLPPDTQIFVMWDSIYSQQGRKVTATLEKMLPFDCKIDDWDIKKFQINNDVAVIRLHEPINDVRTARIECTEAAPEDKTPVTMMGFGEDENADKTRLRIADAFTRTCDLKNRYPIIRDIYCVDANYRYGTFPGQGDSGGPLLIQKSGSYVIIGVYHGHLFMKKTKCSRWRFRQTELDFVVTWANMTALCHWYDTAVDELKPEEEKGRGKNKGKNCIGKGCFG